MEHTIYNFWGLIFFTQHNSLETPPSCYLYQEYALFIVDVLPWYECTTFCLTTHPLRNI